MKQFSDYGIVPIKCETKMGGTEVKDELYKVNDILYHHKMDYVCPTLLKRVRGELRVALISLNNKKVPPIAQRKKEEILQKGKAYFQQMKELEQSFIWEQTDADDIQRVLRFRVASYLKEKPSLTPTKAMKLLKESNQVYEDYYTEASHHIALDQVSTGTFKSMQKELQDFILFSVNSLTSAS